MNRILSLTLGGLTALLLAFPAFAQPAGTGGGQNGPAMDCGKARNPAQCEARQKAREACQGKRGAARRQCMADQMPPPDCSKARQPQRCEAMSAAREACKGKVGKERRQCMRTQAKAK